MKNHYAILLALALVLHTTQNVNHASEEKTEKASQTTDATENSNQTDLASASDQMDLPTETRSRSKTLHNLGDWKRTMASQKTAHDKEEARKKIERSQSV